MNASAALLRRRAERCKEEADELETGPQTVYGVWRWSETRRAAETYAQSLRNKGGDVRVVLVEVH